MENIYDCYRKLRAARLCPSAYSLSRTWLNHSAGYYSVLKGKGIEVSVSSLLSLYMASHRHLDLLEKSPSSHIVLSSAKTTLLEVIEFAKRELISRCSPTIRNDDHLSRLLERSGRTQDKQN